jgi:hypothetical protein
MLPGLRLASPPVARRGRRAEDRGVGEDHLVDDPVLLGLLGGHEEVAVRVLGDPLERLAGVVQQDPVQLVADTQDLPRWMSILCLALHPAKG